MQQKTMLVPLSSRHYQHLLRFVFLAFYEVGGFSGLLEKYPQAVPKNVSAIVVNQTCHYPDRQAFRMLRDVGDDYMPWLGFLLGQTSGSIWYWCADQVSE